LRNFKDLVVWDKAHALTLELYQMTHTFPKEELYGITSQIRRAAASIGANLAEGCGRRTDGEFGRFLLIAMGSASESTYHLLLARDLKFLNEADYVRLDNQLAEVRRMLTSLTMKVKPISAASCVVLAKS
jgi:four helix bundle protein